MSELLMGRETYDAESDRAGFWMAFRPVATREKSSSVGVASIRIILRLREVLFHAEGHIDVVSKPSPV